jgi:hypothetical protein
VRHLNGGKTVFSVETSAISASEVKVFPHKQGERRAFALATVDLSAGYREVCLYEFDLHGGRVTVHATLPEGVPTKGDAVLPAQSPPTRGGGFVDSVVTPQGLGPIKIGMTIAEASAASGTQLVKSSSEGKCSIFIAENVPQGHHFGVTVIGGRIVSIGGFENRSIATAEGIRIGDPESKVLRVYQGRIKAHKYAEGHGDYFDTLVYSPSGLKPNDNIMIFVLGEGNTVSQILVGKVSATRGEQQGIMSQDGPRAGCK